MFKNCRKEHGIVVHLVLAISGQNSEIPLRECADVLSRCTVRMCVYTRQIQQYTLYLH